jgi:DNA repair exonuclease SbcCD ATPase subunit
LSIGCVVLGYHSANGSNAFAYIVQTQNGNSKVMMERSMLVQSYDPLLDSTLKNMKLWEINKKSAEKIEELTEINDGLRQEIEELTEIDNNHKRKIKKLTETNNDLQQEIEELTETNDGLRREIEELTKGKDNFCNALATLIKEKDSFKKEILRLEEENKKLRETSEGDGKIIEEFGEVIQKRDQYQDNIQNKVVKLRNSIGELGKSVRSKALKERIEAVLTECEELCEVVSELWFIR